MKIAKFIVLVIVSGKIYDSLCLVLEKKVNYKKKILSEVEKWKPILKRLLGVTLFLAFRRLPF
jgi:hypothetical protein